MVLSTGPPVVATTTPGELAAAGFGPGSLRIRDGASSFGNRAARSSWISRLVLPHAACNSSRWFSSVSASLSSASPVRWIEPESISSKITGNRRNRRAAVIRRKASPSLICKARRQ